MKRLLSWFVALTVCSGPALAQQATGRFNGRVLDTSGMPIPKVQITVRTRRLPSMLCHVSCNLAPCCIEDTFFSKWGVSLIDLLISAVCFMPLLAWRLGLWQPKGELTLFDCIATHNNSLDQSCGSAFRKSVSYNATSKALRETSFKRPQPELAQS